MTTMNSEFRPLTDNHNVNEDDVDKLQHQLRKRFIKTCEKYDVELPAETSYETLYEVATGVLIRMEPTEGSVQEAVTHVLSDLEQESSGESTILFLCGVLMARYPEAEITAVGNQIYGTIKQAEIDGRIDEYN